MFSRSDGGLESGIDERQTSKIHVVSGCRYNVICHQGLRRACCVGQLKTYSPILDLCFRDVDPSVQPHLTDHLLLDKPARRWTENPAHLIEPELSRHSSENQRRVGTQEHVPT